MEESINKNLNNYIKETDVLRDSHVSALKEKEDIFNKRLEEIQKLKIDPLNDKLNKSEVLSKINIDCIQQSYSRTGE